jgi:hypothetical protein
VSILGRVNFTPKAEVALDKVQPARYQAQPAPNWSDLESRLRELATLSSELSSQLAVEPHVPLAHDPRDPLSLLEQLNRRNRPTRGEPAGTNAINPPMPAAQAEPAGEPSSQPLERKQDPLPCCRTSHPIQPKIPDPLSQ